MAALGASGHVARRWSPLGVRWPGGWGQLPASLAPPALAVRGFATAEFLANDEIPFQHVRVVDDDGLVGDFHISEARTLARQRRLDLVVLSGAVQPPLCRLVGIDAYREELGRSKSAKRQRGQDRLLQEFSFDPALKVKGMRFTSVVDEHALERKVNQIRKFVEAGHRVEARILQGRAPPEDAVDLALRIIAEVRDIAKPEDLQQSVAAFHKAIREPTSLKRSGKGTPCELRLRLWPCTPEQAAAFRLPASILGPRRRKGPAIVGLDDGPEMENAWKYNRKDRARDTGKTAFKELQEPW